MTTQIHKFISKKTDFNKTTDPTVNDDFADGYVVGSRWFNINADTEYICVDSTNGAAIWRQTVAIPIVSNTYANINSNYSPTVRWVPTDLSGTAGSLVWPSTVGSGTIDAQGSSANFVAASVGGKNAFYSNPSSETDGTKYLRLNLGATYAGTGDLTFAFILQDIGVNGTNNNHIIGLLDATPTVDGDFATTTDISALYVQNATTVFRSFYNSASINWSPGANFTTVGSTPALVVCRYTHSGTQWKVWINNATDLIATTNTINLGSLSIRNIQFGKLNSADQRANTLRVAEVIFWDSPLTDQNVTDLSTALLVEYTARIGIQGSILGQTISHNGTNWQNTLKSEYAKTSAPTINDDTSDGYVVGSTWFDITNDKAYICVDVTLGAAVWIDITQSGSFTAGDGVDIGLGTLSLDLKANSGLIIDTTELALDLGATTITGSLAATKGGTGQTSYAIGDLLYASTTTALSKLADIATGNALLTGGVGVAPSYGKIGLTTHITGTLPVANGGTNLTSYAIGDIIYATGTTTLAKLADIATGNALITGGVGVAPSYGKIGLATHVTGTLPVASGGTNLTSYTTGDIVYASAAGTLDKLADIATGNALISQGVGVAPAYGKIGLTTHITGTLAVASGGTNLTSYTTGDILYASAAGTLAGRADIATGNALISQGVGVAPVYGKIGLATHVTGTLPVANGGFGTTTLTANGILLGNGTSAITALKSEFAKITNPIVTDDSVAGYAVGSRWIDTTADRKYICLDATTNTAVWKEVVTVPIPSNNTYANINSNYSPIVRWIPSGLSGTAGALTWNSTVGSGTIDAQGTSANFVAASVGGKAAFYSNPSSETDATKYLRLNLGANYAGTGDLTFAFVVQDLNINGIANNHIISLLDDTPTSGADFSETTNIIALYVQNGTLPLRSFYNNASILWSPGTNYTTIGSTPVVVICRYTHSGTQWKVWINNVTDLVAATNTINLGSLSIRNIQFGKANTTDQRTNTLRVAEVMFWDSPLTDQNVTDLSTAILSEYGVRTSSIFNLTNRIPLNNGTSWQAALQSEYAKTVAPTNTDDSTDGYEIGSQWFDITADKVYICLDATVSSSVWKEITKENVSELNDVLITSLTNGQILRYNGTNWVNTLRIRNDATTVPTVTNDSTQNYTVGSFWYDITNDETFVCLDATATTAVWKLVSEQPYLTLNQTSATSMSTVTPALSASITTYQLVFSESNTNTSTRCTLDTNTIKINLVGTYRLETDVSMNVGTQTATRIYRIGFQESTTSATASFTNINTAGSIKIGNINNGSQYITGQLHHYITISTVPTWIRLVTSLDSYDTATRDVEHGTTFTASFVKL